MRIIFEKLWYRNFLATGNDWTEMDLNKNASTVIVGNNGAGKTTFIDALTFALYGKAFRNINKPLLVNTINKEQCVVKVEFSIGKIKYMVIRGIKPTVFEIYRSGRLINQDSGAKDYQNVLEKTILRMNFKAFSQVVVLGSKTYIPFMRLDAADRRAVVDDLLDIQTYTSMGTILRQALKDIETDLLDLSNRIEFHEEKLRLQEKHILELSQDNTTKIANNEREIEETKSTIFDLEKSIEEARLPQPEYFNADVLNSYQTMINKLSLKKRTLEKEIKFYTETDKCASCHQHIHEDFKIEELGKRQEKTSALDIAISELTLLLSAEEFKQTENSQLWVAYRIASNTIDTWKRETNGHKKWLKKLQNENDLLKLGNGNTDQAISQKDKFLQELQEVKTTHDEKFDDRNHIEYAISLLKDSGIKSAIVKQYVPIINNFINKYLSLIEFSVNFSLNEQFEEKLFSRFRDEFSYENFSDGEKLRIDLAILYSWRNVAKLKNSIDTNLLIMDEILDSSLDVFGIEDFFKMMQSMEGSNTNMFVISHQGDILADKFDNIIKFEKKKDFSELVE